MRLVKKLSSIVASIIIILAIGGYVFVRNFDLNRYKPYIEDIVFNATGRVLKMEGNAQLAISLVPTVEINNVSLSNPTWAKNPNMAEMDKLEIKFAIMPLLKKQIVIDKLILHGTKIYLEKSYDGKANWIFDTNSKSEKNIASVKKEVKVNNATEAAVGMVLVARHVDISDGVVNYYDAKSDNNHLLEIENFNANLDGFDSPLNIDGVMKYNGEKISIEAKISTVNSIINDDKLSFDAKLNALNVKADIIGAVEGVLSNPIYAAEGNIYNPLGNFSLPKIDLNTRIDGDITSADILLKKLLVANNEISGKTNVNWSGEKVAIKADLMASEFNVNDVIPNNKQAFAIPSLISNANALTFVPNNVADFSFLNAVNAEANVKIGNLILPQKTELKDVDAKAKLQNGLLNVNPFSFDVGGGKVSGKASLSALSNSINLDMKTENLKLQDISHLGVGKKSLLKVEQGGDLMIDLSISTLGNTYRKMSENINGRVIAIMDKASISGTNTEWLSNSILGQILSLLKIDTSKAKNLNVNCAVIRSDIKNGKAVFPSGIAFNSEQIQLVGSGDVNLINDDINFTLAPTLNKLADGNITQALASFIRIEGTLTHPKLRLDTSSALSTIVGAVATGGISFGGEVLLSGDDDACYSALVNTAYANKFKQTKGIKSGTKRAYQEVNKQAKEVIKGVEDLAKNLFGNLKNQF